MNLDIASSTIQKILDRHDPLEQMQSQFTNPDRPSQIRELFDQETNQFDEELQKRVFDEIFAWGPIESIKNQIDIFDIVINGPEDIYLENANGMVPIKDRFLSPFTYQNFCEELFKKANIQVSQKVPFGNGYLKPFRIHVTIPPISPNISITLRRLKEQSLNLNLLLNQGFLKLEQYNILKNLLKDRKNILIIGPTGSGKTTFLNSLLQELPISQRIIIIEDTDELLIPNSLSTKLLTRESDIDNLPTITMENLVKQSLRMRPDRIVVGEVRGTEAKDLLMALATGHCGSMGTLHANSAHQAIYRLEMLIQMGSPQWNLESIRRLILMSLQYIVVLKEDRYVKGIEGIYKIASLEKIGLLLEKLI